MAVTQDGRRAVSASWDTTLEVRELATGRELHTLDASCLRRNRSAFRQRLSTEQNDQSPCHPELEKCPHADFREATVFGSQTLVAPQAALIRRRRDVATSGASR